MSEPRNEFRPPTSDRRDSPFRFAADQQHRPRTLRGEPNALQTKPKNEVSPVPEPEPELETGEPLINFVVKGALVIAIVNAAMAGQPEYMLAAPLALKAPEIVGGAFNRIGRLGTTIKSVFKGAPGVVVGAAAWTVGAGVRVGVAGLSELGHQAMRPVTAGSEALSLAGASLRKKADEKLHEAPIVGRILKEVERRHDEKAIRALEMQALHYQNLRLEAENMVLRAERAALLDLAASPEALIRATDDSKGIGIDTDFMKLIQERTEAAKSEALPQISLATLDRIVANNKKNRRESPVPTSPVTDSERGVHTPRVPRRLASPSPEVSPEPVVRTQYRQR